MRSRRGFSILLISLGLGACLSPTLPLPPPEQPQVDGPDPETGQIRLRGSVPAESEVLAMNLRTDEIRGQHTDDGNYDFYLGAEIGDEVALYYHKATVESPSILFLVRDPNAQ
jgi:hypothetical protein